MKKLIYILKNNITYLDLFAFVNAFLFLMMTIFVYYDRFIEYRGVANLHEFFFYASVIFTAIAYTWIKYRDLDVNISILVMIEITILIHFAGAFININGHRLYDFRLFDIRYDKFVHFTNSVIGCYVILYLFQKNGYEVTKFILAISVLSTLGIGAIIEIIEFIVTLSVKHNGVGGYNNNMFDLLANLLGGLSLVSYYLYRKK